MVFWSPGRLRKTFLRVMAVSDCVSCGRLLTDAGSAAGVSAVALGTPAEAGTELQLPSGQTGWEEAPAASALCCKQTAFPPPAKVTSKTANSVVRKTK